MEFWASEFARLRYCPGSRQAQDAYKQKWRIEADEGKAAHWVADQALTTGLPVSDFLGQTHGSVFIDQEIIHNTAVYVDMCREMPGPAHGVEQKYRTHHLDHRLTAKIDFWSHNAETGTLSVADLKYGHGWVEAEENAQLLCGAMCLMETFLKNVAHHIKTVELIIVQPRANHPAGSVRRWSFDAVLMRNEINGIHMAMDSAAMSDPIFQTGEHCRYCRAILHCHANEEAVAVALDVSRRSWHERLTNEQIGHQLDVLERAGKLISHRFVAMEEEALAVIKKGQAIPGRETRQTYGNLSWKGDAIGTGKLLGVDLAKPAEPITPTQAKDRKILTEKQVSDLAERRPGKFKLHKLNIKDVRRIINGR